LKHALDPSLNRVTSTTQQGMIEHSPLEKPAILC
jgi:hypothetical protein